MSGRSGRRARGPDRTLAVAVGAAHRLPCAARPGVVRRNSLRSLRELRSDRAPQVRCMKRASRADPGTALLGAPDSALSGPRALRPDRPDIALSAGPPRCAAPCRATPPLAVTKMQPVFAPTTNVLCANADQLPHIVSTHKDAAEPGCDSGCARRHVACKGAGRGSGGRLASVWHAGAYGRLRGFLRRRAAQRRGRRAKRAS